MIMKLTLLTGKTYDIEAELGFPIKIVKSTRAKRLTLRIDTQERLPILTIPSRCSARRAIDFVESHRDWIDEVLARIPEAKSFADGDKITFFGRELTICHAPAKRCGACEENGILYVSGRREFIHRRVKDYLKKQAQIRFYELSKQQADKLGCSLKDVTMKDTKSRWGSCSSLHNINYNWRISLAPDYVIAYMVAHEVSHLKHQDHSDKFWRCVSKLCPGYATGQAWLKTSGKELYRYE